MAPLGGALGATAGEQNANASAIAHYVRSLSGLSANPTLIAKGQQQFGVIRVACHGIDAKGNHLLGAPNLTDDIGWAVLLMMQLLKPLWKVV
ncbi:cytochrome-c oxidase, cbb3-type subunit III [Oligella ureolytica]